MSLVASEGGHRATVPEAKEPLSMRIARRLPLGYEVMHCGYNLVALPWLLWKTMFFRPDFVYERYSLFNFTGVLVAFLTPVALQLLGVLRLF